MVTNVQLTAVTTNIRWRMFADPVLHVHTRVLHVVRVGCPDQNMVAGDVDQMQDGAAVHGILRHLNARLPVKGDTTS